MAEEKYPLDGAPIAVSTVSTDLVLTAQAEARLASLSRDHRVSRRTSRVLGFGGFVLFTFGGRALAVFGEEFLGISRGSAFVIWLCVSGTMIIAAIALLLRSNRAWAEIEKCKKHAPE